MITILDFAKLALVSCLALMMLGCASSRNTPQLNPHPKHFLTIKGYIAPELKGKVYLAFVQSYAENNDKCVVVTNWLAGAKGLAARDVIFISRPNKDGRYVVKIPLDKYLPGECEWASWAASYSLTSSATAPLLSNGFIEYGSHAQPIPRFYNFICHNGAHDCKIKVPKHAYGYLFINPNKSQIINMNIIYRRKK